MKLIMMIAAAGLGLLAAQDAPKKDKAPEISDALQKEYWKELSVFHNINANYQEAIKTATVDEKLLKDQRDRVNAAKRTLAAACGEKFELDEEQFNKNGVAACIVRKPAEPKKPAPKDK